MNEPAEELAEGQVHGRKRRVRWITAIILLILLIGFLVPLISLGRYHRTIADSLTRSLGHTVHLSSINLTVFPLPGLVIHDFVVEEDPAFGAEPLLRAPEVTVYLRLSSLWNQRLEISRIDLDDASVNLVREPSGRWNFSSLLLQASRTATAPTAQRHPSAAPRFPYIDFSDARINFKEGYEKKAFSLFNTDASVWLADPNRWRIRLEAEPARTNLDLDLEDTGTMRLEGSLTRASSLDQLPLDLHAEWTGAQLGQVSRLMFGSDTGWRGDLRVEADITGNMRDLSLSSRLRVANAHRLEFTPLNELDIDARCQAIYHRPQQLIDNLTCLLPTGDGHLLLTGSVANLTHPLPNLNLEINHTPVSFAVSVLGLLRRGLPLLLDASGTINGQFTWAPQAIPAKFATPHNILTGHAVADSVAVHLAGVDDPVTFAALRFTTPAPPAEASSHRRKAPAPAISSGSPNVVLLEPAGFAAGEPAPMQLSGQFSRSGFSLRFTGESSLARLEPVARVITEFRGFQNLASQGTAQSDLTLAGPWILPVTAQTGATLQGWMRLQHTQFKPAWLPEPLEIATATAQFGSQSGNGAVTWANASVSVNGIAVKGSATYPIPCDDPDGCPAQINLDFPTLDATALQSAILGSGRHNEFLETILSSVESPAPPWPSLTGTIHAGTLSIKDLKLSNATAVIHVKERRLNIISLNAGALGGSVHVSGSLEAASGGPQYALNLAWTGVKLPQAAALFHEKWGTGSVTGQAHLNLHGYTSLATTATGDFSWIVKGNWGGAWTDGSPPLSPAPSLVKASRILTSQLPSQWTAAGTIANQTLTFTKGPALGTITFDRALDLVWSGAAEQQNLLPPPSQAAPPIHVTGTIARPVVAVIRPPAPKTPNSRSN